MAKVAALRRWQPVPNTSRDFKIVTKLSNLGDDLYKKNIQTYFQGYFFQYF